MDQHVLFVALVAFVALVVLVAITQYATRHMEKRMNAWSWSDEELLDVRTMGRARYNSQYGIEKLVAPLKQEGIAFSHPGNL